MDHIFTFNQKKNCSQGSAETCQDNEGGRSSGFAEFPRIHAHMYRLYFLLRFLNRFPPSHIIAFNRLKNLFKSIIQSHVFLTTQVHELRPSLKKPSLRI